MFRTYKRKRAKWYFLEEIYCFPEHKYLHIQCTDQCLASSKLLTPPPPFHPASVSSPRTKGGGMHTRRAVRGWGVNSFEDARHWIGLLQYNPSTPCILIFIAGDDPRLDTDWGLHQLDTVRSVLSLSLRYCTYTVLLSSPKLGGSKHVSLEPS
jgi:hypothetical protein